jgi:hypothetical protein
MGWTYYYECETKAAMRERILRECAWQSESSSGKPLLHRTVGNHLWVAQEHTTAPYGVRRTVVLFLLAKSDGAWGYKDMDETMHPYYYDCPQAVIDAAGPTTHPEAIRWREAVAAHRARKSAERAALGKLKIGCTVRLKPGCTPTELTVVGLKPLTGVVSGAWGTYKIPRKLIAEIIDG